MNRIADQYVEAMHCTFQAAKAAGVNLTYRIQITGDGGGSWGIDIHNGQCSIRAGAPRNPTTTITLSVANYLELSKGKLNVTQAYQSGQLYVSGDLNVALKFVEFFPPWAAYVGQDCQSPESGSDNPPEEQPGNETDPGQLQTTLLNGSFDEYQPFVYKGETRFWKENQYPEKFGKYWELDVLDVGDSRLHLMDSGTFGRFTQRYFGGGGLDYRIHGTHSQVVTSRYDFDIVLRQTVVAQVGKNYTFSGAIVTFYKGTGSGATHDKIFLNIGLDPTGGTDYSSRNVVWSGRDGRNNEWRYPSVQAAAQADKLTVFIRLENSEKDVGQTELNTIHLDNFKLQS